MPGRLGASRPLLIFQGRVSITEGAFFVKPTSDGMKCCCELLAWKDAENTVKFLDFPPLIGYITLNYERMFDEVV